ncbi:MAG: metal ABC transporter permease [Acidimicrobiaceae bacterium]|jgi:ABC-type Mn2+/Zn2+ transport system permease subunit|nr:metal ABC transporter permease [Ilumatobacteraceae bacterium]NQW68520.1 metal ABC transporter permease [Acidimicrobiaceae bacterium]
MLAGNPFVDPFTSNEFMRHALVASVLVALVCAVAGTYVVLRGLSFVGDALAHGVVPGIATALLFGVSGVVGAVVSAAVMMTGVSVITRKSRLSSDTAIGLFFVGMLALGVIITSRSRTFVGDITRILFGELLGVTTSDLGWLLVALVIVAIIATIAHRPFVLMSIDDGLARTSGFSVPFFHSLMLVLVAITVIASFQSVGTLLVLGMLIAPAAAGALVARRVSTMMLIAALYGTAASYLGLLASYHYDIAAGGSIVFVAVMLFGVTAIISAVVAHRHDDEVPHQHEHHR